MFFRQISKNRACPACHGSDVYRLKRVGLAVKAVCRLLDLRPHWCASCDTFFLAPKSSRSVAANAGMPLPGSGPGGPHQPQAGGLPH
jgi:hypothetical protein